VQKEQLACFKAYDIRGRLGDELNEDIAYRIGKAFVIVRDAELVVIGGDIRHSSEALKNALAQGIIDAGGKVIDLGRTGTEEVYFASFYLDVDGGIEVTASHNPIDYNGMKLVGRGAQPISGDSGLQAIRDIAETLTSPYSGTSITEGKRNVDKVDIATENVQPNYQKKSVLNPYVEHLLSYIDLNNIKPLRLVVNAGNGAAGHVVDAIEKQFISKHVPIEFIKVQNEPDGNFPNGIPNPLLPENRQATCDAIKKFRADFGIAWDGDFDRCFLFDENARFIEGYYIVGLLAEAFLQKLPGEKIIHDPRLTWNTIDQVTKAGGLPIQSKTGHAFIKERMRLENAVYGGEMSAHHYFRDFAYCDSGMIPWLLIAELVSVLSKPLSKLVDERMKLYPCSGEINYRVKNIESKLERILSFYSDQSPEVDMTDGVSLEFDDWRFNLRSSNTEPLLRLNVEARENSLLVKAKVEEIESIIKA
jgi:phosphomannomutase/phosphomannomutase/phosphoglucomutase